MLGEDRGEDDWGDNALSLFQISGVKAEAGNKTATRPQEYIHSALGGGTVLCSELAALLSLLSFFLSPAPLSEDDVSGK